MKVHRRSLKDRPKMFASLIEPVDTPPATPRFLPTPKPRTAEKMGSRYMKELGRRGGKANVTNNGPEHMAAIGRKGGQHPRRV